MENSQVSTEKNRIKMQTKTLKGIALVLGILVILEVVFVAALLMGWRPGGQKNSFTPPAFDPAAVAGTPEVDKSLGWSPLEVRKGYSIHVCGVLRPDSEGAVPVWFTSDAGNEVWVKLRVVDDGGNVLGESGVLRPGEYVEKVKLTKVPEATCAVSLKVIGYEPDTWYSAGTMVLNTELTIE